MPQIFVVEDDEAIRIELVQLLERNGCEVRCAERYEHVGVKGQKVCIELPYSRRYSMENMGV